MDICGISEKVKLLHDRFYELYGKEVYDNPNLSDKACEDYYEIDGIIVDILHDFKMASYDMAEE